MCKPVCLLSLLVFMFLGCNGDNSLTSVNTFEIRGNGNAISKAVELPDFNSISNTVLNKVLIKRGNKCSLVLKAEQNIFDVITTEVNNGWLEIALLNNKSISTNFPVEAKNSFTGNNFDT